MLEPSEIADLIWRSRTHPLSASEEAQLQAWRHASPDNEALYALWQDDAQVATELGAHYRLADACWEDICKKTGISLPAAEPAPVIYLWWARWRGGIRATAIHAVIIGAVFLVVWLIWQLIWPKSSQPPVVVQTLPREIEQTGYGERKTVLLPDGSTVYLNARSRLQYGRYFDMTKREVFLEGEAEFSVSKQQGLPFLIRVPGIRFQHDTVTIEVVGTRFNVKAYSEERQVLTTVSKGIVKVHADAQTDSLRPGQQNRVDPLGLTHAYAADAGSATAWTRDSINFDEVPAQDAMRELERWYEVRIGCLGNKREKLSGGFSHHQRVEEILDLLHKTDYVSYRKINKDSIVVTIK